MLLKLNPEKVEKGWNQLAPPISQAFGGVEGNRQRMLTNILKAVLLDRAHVWVEVDETRTPRALVVTTFQEDIVMHTKALLVYGLVVLEAADSADWKSGIETLKTFAESRGCSHLEFHVHSADYERYLSMLGAQRVGSVMIHKV